MRIALFLLVATAGFSAERVACPVTADATVTFADMSSRPEPSRGAERELIINGRLSFAILQFDTSALKGLAVRKATLRMHRAPAPVPLHTIGLSTISGNGPWSETEAIFLRPSPDRYWSYRGSDLVDVTFAQGGSLYTYVRVRDAGNGWWEADVPPALVHALSTGDQFGLMLTDEKGQTRQAHAISSRESSNPPVLIVEAERTDRSAPGPVRARQAGDRLVISNARDDGNTGVATRVDLRYSRNPIADFETAGAYPRWLIDPLAPKPHPMAIDNSLQDEVTVNLDELVPGETYYFAACAIDKAGNAGPVVQLGRVSIPKRNWPQLPVHSRAVGSDASSASKPSVWAVPETLKINPRTGTLLEADFPDHRVRNTIWNAASRTVKLTGARNEFVAFQLAVEGTHQNVSVEVAKPLFPGLKLPAVFKKTGPVQLYREWFVRDDKDPNVYLADPLVPLASSFNVPSQDNPVPGQTVQPLFVDVYVPHAAKPGRHQGELLVRSPSGLNERISLEVEVLPFALPDNLSFIVDLNCYSGVEGPPRGTPEYRAVEHAFHRVAHLHRANLNILGYSHTGTTVPDHTPPLTGEGRNTRVADWTDWDAHWGPLVSGRLFGDLPRAGVPAAAMYLPFFENWPGELRRHYRADDPTIPKTEEQYQALVTRHALTAPPVEEAFSPEYQERFSAVIVDFARHIKERGWHKQTQYQVYFNNKYYWKRPSQGGRGIGWWLLDEPNHRDDVRAIGFLGWLAKRRLNEHPDVPIVFRTDISRIDWMRDLLAGQVDLNCISRRFNEKTRYLQQDRYRFGKQYWNYASSNHPRDTNVAMRAWAWRTWLNGGDGILPWLATRTQNAWERAEPLTVFYSGTRFGQAEPFASLRLKAYRRGQQDIEYLILLARRQGWDREAVTSAVKSALDLSAQIEERYEEDAGVIRFQKIQDAQLDEVRLRVARAMGR